MLLPPCSEALAPTALLFAPSPSERVSEGQLTLGWRKRHSWLSLGQVQFSWQALCRGTCFHLPMFDLLRPLMLQWTLDQFTWLRR